MGQAGVDLPNSVEEESAAAAAPAASADDLLSQLAGEEIDRLLAEADGNASPAKQAVDDPTIETSKNGGDDDDLLNAPLEPVSAGPQVISEPASDPIDAIGPVLNVEQPKERQPDDVLAKPEGIAGEAAPPPPPTTPSSTSTAPATADPAVQAQLEATAAEIDAVLNEAGANQTPIVPAPISPRPLAEAAAAPAPIVAPTSTRVETATAAVAPAPLAAADSQTSAAERAGLAGPLEDRARAVNAASPAALEDPTVLAELDAGESDAPLPIYLRPLEWISSPLAALPEPVRDVFGKAAIITLANALAVLIYVMFFRNR